MRGSHRRRREDSRARLVPRRFQIAGDFIQPSEPNRRLHLLAEHDRWPALADEPEHVRPEVPLVGVSPSLPGCGIRLARTTAGPAGSVVGPSSQSKSERPSANASEEVHLDEPLEVGRLDFGDAPLIDFTFRDQPVRHQFSQPCGRMRIELVEIVHPCP